MFPALSTASAPHAGRVAESGMAFHDRRRSRRDIFGRPDSVARGDQGQVVVGRVKTGKPQSNAFDDIEYTILRLAAVQAYGDTHRYVITVTALKIPKLPVDANATPAVVGFVAHYQPLAKATMTVEMRR
jgi:phosphatidylethanolamine-binding protein (PEBP) family uncharacterized protein